MKLITKVASFLFVIVSSLNCNIVLADSTRVGKVEYMQGVVSAETKQGNQRLLGEDSPIYETDSIVTGSQSFAVLVFLDNTKVTVRPQSEFVVREYQYKKNTEDKAFFGLLKGGIRTVTGAINQDSSDKILLDTPVATMAMKKSDVVAWVCDGNCEDNDGNQVQDTQSIARVALARKEVQVKDDNGSRVVKAGYRLKEKDTVLTDQKGFAVLVFEDKTRITVESATELNIQEYFYPKGRPQQGKAFFNLIKGGARTLTGLIGKANPDQFKLKTPVAIMGIRGTGFDTYHDEDTFLSVWEGAITAKRLGETQLIKADENYRVDDSGFDELIRLPPTIENRFRAVPRPDRVDTQNIWVSVNEGDVMVTERHSQGAQTVKLKSGDIIRADRSEIKKKARFPRSLSNDPYTKVSPDKVKRGRETNRQNSSNKREKNEEKPHRSDNKDGKSRSHREDRHENDKGARSRDSRDKEPRHREPK